MMSYAQDRTAKLRTGVCRNCAARVESRYGDRWVNRVEWGDVCHKADDDKNAPYGAISRNRIHAVDDFEVVER